ncbi:MAG: hypothetical protein NVS4B12_20780 [Ktedonobacteraceae bacterium]
MSTNPNNPSSSTDTTEPTASIPLPQVPLPDITEVQRVAAETSYSGRKAVSRGTMFLAFYLWLLSGAGILSWIAQRTQFFPGDMSITARLQRQKNPWFRNFMYWVSEIGFWQWSVPQTIGVAGVFWALRFRLEALFILLTTSSNILNAIVKRVIKRPRPDKELVSVVRVINEPSFPSGHVMHYTNFYGLLIYLLATNWKPGRLRNALIGLCTGMITTIGPSRIYLGAHWPSDVMAGYLYGGLWFGGIITIYLRVKAWLHPPKGTQMLVPQEIVKPLQQPGDEQDEHA